MSRFAKVQRKPATPVEGQKSLEEQTIRMPGANKPTQSLDDQSINLPGMGSKQGLDTQSIPDLRASKSFGRVGDSKRNSGSETTPKSSSPFARVNRGGAAAEVEANPAPDPSPPDSPGSPRARKGSITPRARIKTVTRRGDFRSSTSFASTQNKEKFLEPFSTKDFTEQLMQVQVVKSRASGSAFDPDPFLDIIEDTTEALMKLNREVETKILALEQQTKAGEEQHKEELTGLTQALEFSVNNFEALEERIKKVAAKAVHIGDQLETMNLKKERAQEARDLMKYFSEFDDDDTDTISSIFSDDSRNHEAADILHKLNTVVQSLPGHNKPKERIKQKCENIERKILRQFSNAYDQKDYDTMKKCAQTLTNFKGYEQCMKDYINQHPFFLDVSSGTNENASDVFGRVAIICENEVEGIKLVFAQPEIVMSRFLERIFEQKLGEYVDRSLEEAKSKGNVEYLESLNILHKGTCELRSRLLKMELCNDAGLLGRLIENLFCLHLPEGRYIQNEIECLKNLYIDSINQHYMSIGYDRIEERNNFFAARKEISSELPLLCLNSDIAMNMIFYNRNSIERCNQLSVPDRIATNSGAVFQLLLDYLMSDFLENALDLGISCLDTWDPKLEPDMNFLQLAYRANQISHVLHSHYEKHLVPAISTSYSVQVGSAERMKTYTERIQEKVELGLKSLLREMCEWIGRILARQPKGEYDIQDLDGECTITCKTVVQYMEKQIPIIDGGLDGNNKENFVLEFAARLQHIYLNHMQRLVVSNVGALLLVQDVDLVISCMKRFKVPMVGTAFAVLRELCSVFTLQAENVVIGLKKGHLNRLDRATLIGMLESRADWKVSKKLIESRLR